MIHPPNQTVTAKEGESLNIVVEFCAEPRHTKIFWISEENVYVPGAEARDGVQALAIEVYAFFFFFILLLFLVFSIVFLNFQFIQFCFMRKLNRKLY